MNSTSKPTREAIRAVSASYTPGIRTACLEIAARIRSAPVTRRVYGVPVAPSCQLGAFLVPLVADQRHEAGGADHLGTEAGLHPREQGQQIGPVGGDRGDQPAARAELREQRLRWRRS